jgi:carboxylesterase type B
VEIPFVFDTLGLGTEVLVGPTPPQSLADAMHRTWVAFAVNGDCGWPNYDLARRSTMRFDTASAVVDDPLAVQLALWKGYVSALRP